jgi:hypothetical protein
MSDFEVMSIEEAKALREENQRLKDLLEALGGIPPGEGGISGNCEWTPPRVVPVGPIRIENWEDCHECSGGGGGGGYMDIVLGGIRVEPKPGEVFDPLWVEDYGKDRD